MVHDKINDFLKIRCVVIWRGHTQKHGAGGVVQNNINIDSNATSMLRLLCCFCHNYTAQLKQNGTQLSSDVKNPSVARQNLYILIWGKVLSVLRHVLVFLKSPLTPIAARV